MHDDPTRMMRQPEGRPPHGNMRLLVAGLIAVIVGLVIAIFVIAGDSDDGDTVPTPTEVTTLPSTTSETTEPTTTDTTEPTTTETTETSPTTTTTEPTTAPEEDGSGGIEAP